MLAEAVENESKRMRFTAAVSLDEPIDYAPLDGLTVDMLSKISGLTDEQELEGKKGLGDVGSLRGLRGHPDG